MCRVSRCKPRCESRIAERVATAGEYPTDCGVACWLSRSGSVRWRGTHIGGMCFPETFESDEEVVFVGSRCVRNVKGRRHGVEMGTFVGRW